MPIITSEIVIQAPLALVWEIAQEVETFPQILPDLDEIKVLENEQTSPVTRRTVTEWHGRIKQFNRKMQWTEEDIWNYETHTCHFWQMQGDFDEYKGEWRFMRDGSNTRVLLNVEYRFDVPLLGAIMGKVVQKLMQDNSDTMLNALRGEAERRAAS